MVAKRNEDRAEIETAHKIKRRLVEKAAFCIFSIYA